MASMSESAAEHNAAGAPTRVGLIGLGAIGQGVVALARQVAPEEISVVGAVVRDPARTRPSGSPALFTTAEELLAQQPEVVIEVAGHEGLRQHGPAVLRSGRELIAVSVGTLARPEVYDELIAAAEAGGTRLKVTSGAIGALDAISAAALGGLSRVTHTTRKPPRTLLGEEGLTLTEPLEVFRGTAREGVLRFPESINVAAAVSLAGVGLDRTEVVVIADPGVSRNRHEVEAEGAFGRLRFQIENIPSRDNIRSARLVAMSIVRTLLLRSASFAIG